MKRLFAVFCASMLVAVSAAPVAHGGEDIGSVLADVLLGAGDLAPGSVTVVTSAAGAIELSVDHAPLPADSLVVDARNLRAPLSDPIGDAGEGAPDTIDIASAFAVVVDFSPGALERYEPWLAAAHGSVVVDGVGFASPFDGATPSLGAQSVVFGVQSSSWITAEDDPLDVKVSLRYQMTVGGLRSLDEPTESGDANNGNSASIDLYQGGGIFGTGAYDFPGGAFSERSTNFFGLFLGDRAVVAGPLAELDGVEDIEINLVNFPLFDDVKVGGPADWGRLRIDTLAEVDANGDGVHDEFEAPPEPEPEPVDQEQIPEPEPEPAVIDEPASPDEPDDVVGEPVAPAVVEPTDEAPATQEPPDTGDVGDGGDGGDGGNAGFIVAALVLLVAGAVGLYFFLKRRKQCVPESEAVTAAQAEVTAIEAQVARARQKVTSAEATAVRAAGAREQAALRQTEASIALRDAQSELALAQGRLEDARGRLALAQHAYDVCSGLVAPDPEPEPPTPIDPPAPADPPPRPEMPGPPPVETPGDVETPDGTGGGRPGIVTQPPDSEPAAPDPEPGCRDGDEKDGETVSTTDFRILGGVITVGVGTGAWKRAGNTFNAEGFAALDTSTVEELSAGIEQGARKVRIDVRIPIVILTVKCVQILVCENDAWVDSGRTKRVEERAAAPELVVLPVGAAGGRGKVKDKRLAGRMVVEAQAEVETLVQNQLDADDCECD